MTTILVIVIIIMIALSALFAATETAITASSPGRFISLKSPVISVLKNSFRGS